MGISLRSKCKPEKKEFARKMRNNPTPAEKHLWQYLRCKRLGVRAKRQNRIRGYIVDFYIPAWNLAVELDGSIHLVPEVAARDKIRDGHIAEVGITVLRFTNDQALYRTAEVISAIKQHAETVTQPYKSAVLVRRERKEEKRKLIEDAMKYRELVAAGKIP